VFSVHFKTTIMKKTAFNKITGVVSVVLVVLLLAAGCAKFVEPDEPKTELIPEKIFASDDNAKTAIAGLYARIVGKFSLCSYVSRYSGLLSDEFVYRLSSTIYDPFTTNQLPTTNSDVKAFWDDAYNITYCCNSIIEYATASAGMTEGYKKQLINEAKFIRAFMYFYLVNYYGAVPLVTTTDANKTAYLPRNTVEEIYTQIKADLTDARNNLPADYSVSSKGRTRANKWAATALLARVYLYTGDWANAEAMATELVENNPLLFKLLVPADIALVYKKNQMESIFELDATGVYKNTYEGQFFLGTYYGSISTTKLMDYPFRANLTNSFDSADLRKINWTVTANGVTTPYKYKRLATETTNDEDNIILRLAEQYLIRAEARAQQNNISGAQTDINAIRNRAGLANDTTMINKATAMAAIESERRKELFAEWGHRWFDLKRWPSLTTAGKTRADDVLGALKSTWTSTAALFPIPDDSRMANPNLTQNDGY
jgi:starch-binding outer membrane protein, SusD/RagB family